MRGRLLFLLVLVGAASCATAAPIPAPTVVLPQHAAEPVATEPERIDGALPSNAVVIGSIDVRRIDDKVSHALDALGPLGLLALERAFDIPSDVLDFAERRGIAGGLALDTSRPLTFALQGPSDSERRAAEEIGKLTSPISLATFARALADSRSASFRGRLLLPSPDMTITIGRVRALLEGFGLSDEPTRDGIDARFASKEKHIVVELTRGRSVLTVDVVRCYVKDTAELERAMGDALARLRESPPRAAPEMSAKGLGHALHVEYEPEALALLDVITGALTLYPEVTRDALAEQAVKNLAQSLRLVRDDRSMYFDRVSLDDEDDLETFVMTAHFGARFPWVAPAPSITLPVVGRPETLDVDRGFLDALRLPGTDLGNLFSMAGAAGGLGYALALPSVLPWMARDQLGAVGYGPAPVFQSSVRTRLRAPRAGQQ